MSTRTEISRSEPTIVMTRVFDAPRAVLWEVFTDPKHVREWWGGEGTKNPVVEIDLRAGGRWNHVMQFPNGQELALSFVFVEVDAPKRLVWRSEGPHPSLTTVTFDDEGDKTRYTMMARFESMASRDAALGYGFTRPIEASNDALERYLTKTRRAQ